MKRRDFILAGAAGLAVISLPAACNLFTDTQYDPSLAKPDDLSYVMDSVSIASLGGQYLLNVPNENSERRLAHRIMEDVRTEAEDIKPALEEKIRNDFKTGHTVIVDGWVLSVTEARQCGLFSLK